MINSDIYIYDIWYIAFWQRTCPEWYQVLQLDSCLPLSLCQCVPCHLQKTNKIGQSAKKTGCSKLHTGFPDAPCYPRDTNKNYFMVSEYIYLTHLWYLNVSAGSNWNIMASQTLVGGTHPTSKCRAKAAVPFFLPVLRRPFRRSRQRIPGTFSMSKINKSSIWIHLVQPIWRNMDELINAASRTRQTDPKNRHGMTCL